MTILWSFALNWFAYYYHWDFYWSWMVARSCNRPITITKIKSRHRIYLPFIFCSFSVNMVSVVVTTDFRSFVKTHSVYFVMLNQIWNKSMCWTSSTLYFYGSNATLRGKQSCTVDVLITVSSRFLSQKAHRSTFIHYFFIKILCWLKLMLFSTSFNLFNCVFYCYKIISLLSNFVSNLMKNLGLIWEKDKF